MNFEVKKEVRNGYIAIYKKKRIEVEATTSYEAQKIAQKKFKAKNCWDVTVLLCESDGKQIIHTPFF